MLAHILKYLEGRTLDDNTARAIGEAYAKARRMLGNRLQTPVFLEILAKRIIYWATTADGLNSDQVARRALQALGYDPDRLSSKPRAPSYDENKRHSSGDEW